MAQKIANGNLRWY